MIFIVSFLSSQVKDRSALRSFRRSDNSTGNRFSRPDFLQNLQTQSLLVAANSMIASNESHDFLRCKL